MNAILSGLALLLAMILVACASPSSVSTNPPLQEIESAKEATVVLFPMYMESWKALDEERIRKNGCTYTTRNPELIAQLLKLLLTKVTVISHPEKPWEQEPRELVYLKLAGGEEVKFRFSAVFRQQNDVRGVFVTKQREMAVSAELSFPKGLYEWAVNAEQQMQTGSNYSEKGCSFVHDYHDYGA